MRVYTMNRFPQILTSVILMGSILSTPAQNELNVAHPDNHPYVRPDGNRDRHEYAFEQVNEARVYDFYARQADYYREAEIVPDIIPAFPGLDAGLHGHWGKYNQNNHNDGRWNEINKGTVYAQVWRSGDKTIEKGVNIDLSKISDIPMGASFDPLTGSYRAVWNGGFIHIDPYRWGSSRNAAPIGNLWFYSPTPEPTGWEGSIRYFGYSRNSKDVIFRYTVNSQTIHEMPSAFSTPNGPVFVRLISFPLGARNLRLKLNANGIQHTLASTDGMSADLAADGTLTIDSATPGAVLSLAMSQNPLPPNSIAGLNRHFRNTHPTELVNQPGPGLWPESIQVTGNIGLPKDGSAYAVDSIPVPFDNPYKSVMQLTGIDFLPDGDAIVSVLCGDVWKVSGLDESLGQVTWKRFATGLNQPIGVHIDSDGIFILCRDQITRLHDLNHDNEADFYECYANDFGGYDRSHTHVYGLHRASDGSFSFVRREQLVRTSPDPERKTTEIAYGVRNCMAVGGAPDGPFLVAPNEGTWTPASAILEVSPGAFFGLPGQRNDDDRFSPAAIMAPLCFVPRGVDNSTGGMVYIDSEKWGPLSGHFIGLSYGYGQHYLILRDTEGSLPQGGIVPLEGEFAAGVMRGAFHPVDGQLYTVGLDGWGDYSIQDGCLHRVRYTGRPVLKPIGFHVYENGIRLDFPHRISSDAFNKDNFFVQQWNYEYSKQYGSPEYSVRDPESLGHDRLMVSGVRGTSDGRSIFIEIPDLEPCMQLHVRMHLTTTFGSQFSSDLFTTVKEIIQRWTPTGPTPASRIQKLALRIQWSGEQPEITETGTPGDDERVLILNADSGLQYRQKEFTVRPGEAIALHFINADAMPHNAVFVRSGHVKEVGEASFAMLNDPKAADKHYVPESDHVIAHTHVINPGNKHILHFKAPDEVGDHHFVCTFPGHWMTMQGILRVKE